MLDKLKLLGVVVVLFGAAFFVHWWRGKSDGETLDKVNDILEEMCACKDVGCANWVADKFERELGGKKMDNSDVGQNDYKNARLKIDYMKQCHRYIAEGMPFTLERDDKREIRFVRPDSAKKRGPLDGINLEGIAEPQ